MRRRTLVCSSCGRAWTGAQPCATCRWASQRRWREVYEAVLLAVALLLIGTVVVLAVVLVAA